MAARSFPLFEKLDTKCFKAQPSRLNLSGKGRTALLDYVDGPLKVAKFASPKDMRVVWNIKPGSTENAIKEGDKFNLELEITPELEAFVAKCAELDEFALETAFANKADWFGEKNARALTSVDALRIMYTKTVVEGKPNRVGGKYSDSFRVKIDGKWAKYMNELVYREDDPDHKGMPRDCTWHPRIVNALDPTSAVGDNETQFFLHISKDPITGEDQYTDKVPVLDAAGHQIKDATGNSVWRYVGPQDCKQNCRTTVVFTISRAWISDVRFGIALTAKKVFIKGPPAKIVQKLEGVRTVTNVDVAAAARAVMNIQGADAEEDGLEDAVGPSDSAGPAAPGWVAPVEELDDEGAQADAAPEAAAATAAGPVAPAEITSPVGKKRKAEAEPAGAGSKASKAAKSSKAPIVVSDL